jgi:predicted PurR-regulated permease PerM
MSAPAPTPPAAPESPTARAARQDLARVTLAVLCILLLIAGSLWVLLPFVAAIVWATTIVVTTWPLLTSLEARFGGRRAPAVAVMTATMLLLIIVPVLAASAIIVSYAGEATTLARKLTESGLPPPPTWVAGLPLVGGDLSTAWARTAAAGPEGLATTLGPHVADAARWVLGRAGGLVGTVVQFLLVVVLCVVMYSSGETAARSARRFGRRLAGDRGENSVILAGQAIRGVALGVGATAIVQTVLGGLGLLVAGVPFVGLLSAIMLMLCIAQLGPALVLFSAVGWMYWRGDPTWATLLLVWSIFVSVIDNFLRPVLIRKGADLPLLLIIAGVIGGMLGFGLVGIFVGPVVLGVGYRLLEAWIEEDLGMA